MPGTVTHTRPADNAVRLSGAFIGLVVFAVGIGLLYGVFQTAKSLYDSPVPTIPIATPAPTPVPTPTAVASPLPTVKPGVNGVLPPAPSPTPVAPPAPDVTATTVAAVSNTLLGFSKQWFLLLLMCIAGALIASKGIELFYRACAASLLHPPKVIPPPTTTPTDRIS